MSDFKRLAHAIWNCKYHIVWCPKYRFRIMKGAVQKSVKEIISQLCEWKKLEILELNVLEDHVHLIISIPPKYAVSDIIGFLKGKCAIKIFDRHLELKKRYWGRHFWAKGYCVTYFPHLFLSSGIIFSDRFFLASYSSNRTAG